MLTGIAAEQWRSASQSVEDFARLEREWDAALSTPRSPKDILRAKSNLERFKSSPWTMRQAFFADMGGILLDCPDSSQFPVDGHQLVYLVENDHMEYPDVKSRTIWDRNKADTFTRALTLIQIVWFLFQSIGRWAQHLALSTFELSSLAFIFSTINTTFFFWHKPRDVATPVVLPCRTTVADIQRKAHDRARQSYLRTPLDFVKPPISRTSLIAPFWFGIRVCFDWREESDELPTKTFGNIRTTPPRGIKVSDIVYGSIYTLAYFGIHLAGWNFVFPSRTEQMLWRISSLVLLGLSIFYLSAVAFGTVMASRLARWLFKNNEATTILGIASLMPRWLAVTIHSPIFVIYGIARGYIIVEGFVSLRILPVTVFSSVKWSNFVPHF
ncbi:MAG: hypothetical protein Q9164_002577 [Protoblastenia rupestris]